MLSVVTPLILSTVAVPSNTSNSQQIPTPITRVLPADTPLVGFINTSSKDWQSLGQFELFKKAFNAAGKFFPAEMGFNYERDIKSWLGDRVTVAFLPATSTKSASVDTNFLILAPVEDEKQLQMFVDKLRSDKRRKSTERDYKGIKILEWKPPQSTPTPQKQPTSSNLQLKAVDSKPKLPEALPNPPKIPNPPKPSDIKRQQGLAIAFLPGYIATANTAKPLEQLINIPRGTKTLAQNPHFQKTSQHPQFNQALFALYEDPNTFLPLALAIAKEQKSLFPLPNTAFDLEQVKQYSALNGLVWMQPKGLRLQINAYRRTPQPKTNILTPDSGQLLTRIPAPAYSTLSGRNIYQQWQMLVTAFNSNPQFKDGLAKFNTYVRSITGLDVDKDILSWMNGEYAFFTYPTKQGLLTSELKIGIGLYVQTSDRPSAETMLNKLNDSIKSIFSGALAITNRDIDNISTTSWEFGTQSVFAYSWVDDKTLLVSTGLGAMRELLPQPQRQLPKDYNFVTATNSFSRPNQGYFYINMGSSLSWIYSFLPHTSDPSIQTFKKVIGTVYSFSSTSNISSKQEQYDGLIVLAPVRK
ncbi:DUF3352 domain-containing protein [Aliterella atlantica]|uniref:DUF3352 domain-containing protein n=1 Tax=Aliterella atlantica CENA595 TaxID=1618023 RepID=A0A0D8ZQX7_9CYAN|nr:DUF3352 domain-containing protein [Aliterella atlantica]KJH70904.1 hypothetical protein UH38_15010 [Aliterella atlantica CENA595]